MPLRTFVTPDGTRWTVWLVRSTGSAGLPGTPTEWLAFQSADGTERRRLIEIPPGWDMLPDERLDLLRRIADPVRKWTSRHTPPGGVEQRDTSDADGR